MVYWSQTGSPKVQQRVLLEEAEGQEMLGEVAIRKGSQPQQVRREEKYYEHSVSESGWEGRRSLLTVHLWPAVRWGIVGGKFVAVGPFSTEPVQECWPRVSEDVEKFVVTDKSAIQKE